MAKCSHVSGCSRETVPGFALCAEHWKAGEALRAVDRRAREAAAAAARKPHRA